MTIKDKICVATGNTQKFKEIRFHLNAVGVEAEQIRIDLEEIQTTDLQTLMTHKLAQAYSAIQQPVICDDAGLWIEKYTHFPGTLTKFVIRGMGNRFLDLFNNGDKAILKASLGYWDGHYHAIAEGKLKGQLSKKGLSDLPPENPINHLFIPDGHSVCLNKVLHDPTFKSHRQQAIEALLNIIRRST